MTRADYSSPRGVRLDVAAIVIVLHVALGLALVRAFAPDFSARVAEQVFGMRTVTVVTTTPPKPSPSARSVPQAAEREGAATEAGRKSAPAPLAAPSPRIVLAAQAAPPVAGPGNGVTAGARDAGQGVGAGGQGSGPGSGNAGSGQGGGGASKAAKIAGDINSARDYPAATRDLRLGDYVIVALTVGIDGRVSGCTVHRASKDAQADQITCRLATERFRFRPATDSAGNPIPSVFGWQQRWYDPKAATGQKS